MKRGCLFALAAAVACAAPGQRVAGTEPQVRLPESFPLSQQMPGAEVQALMAVANDLELDRWLFLHRWLFPEEELTRCMRGIRARGFTVVRENDVFYVLVTLEPRLCGSPAEYVDTGMIYAVDTDGRIIWKQPDTAPRN